MEFRTIQASVIKNLFESIKEILVDVNIMFNENSMQCTAIDGNKVALVHFQLDTHRFEYYNCQPGPPLIIGINMNSIYKLIKPVTPGDTIIMKVYKNERCKLYIIIENTEKHTRTSSVLKLLDIDQEIIDIPDVEFDNIITIPCSDFQRHCKDIMTVSDKVTFLCHENMFAMKCTGDFADLMIEIQQPTKSNAIENSESQLNDDVHEPNTKKKHRHKSKKQVTPDFLVLQPSLPENTPSCLDDSFINDEICDRFTDVNITGTFSLKYVNLFIKSSSLCSNVEIYLKKGYPLILIYRIGSLGKVQFCLAPNHDD